MRNDKTIEPKHYDVGNVADLPKQRPFAIFDLDGTLTPPEGELLLATFVKSSAMDECEGAEREKLRRAFEDWKDGKKVYENYLEEIGRLYAEMLASAKLTRGRVMELAEKWYRTEGNRDVLPFARPMMHETERFRFNRIMLTGAPMEVAHHFAADIGIENVFSMQADVNADGLYTGRMFNRFNTGLLMNKGTICSKIHQDFATGFGAGNTQSDTVIMETAYFQKADNPIDLKGRAYLMNVGHINDSVVERFMKSSGHHYNDFRYFCIPRGVGETPEYLESFMSFFRSTLRMILIDNQRQDMLYEIEGVRPLTKEEKEALHRKESEKTEWWFDKDLD